MKFECSTLILDLDGTISDPSLGVVRCFNYALKVHGYSPVSDLLIKKEIGPPLNETFLKLVPEGEVPNIDSLIAIYRERYAEVGFSENALYSGMSLVLETLYNSGLTLGVCTSKRQDFAEKILSMFEVKKYFSFIDGGDIGVTKGSQLEGLLRSEVIDKQAIMVGDRAIDINSAKMNDLRSLGVLWGFGNNTELLEASPLCILESVDQLSNIVVSN